MLVAVSTAQQPVPDAAASVKPIEPPAKPLPPEAETANITRFSFIAYGDSRSGNEPGVPGDGQVLQVAHTRLMDVMLGKIDALSSTPFPVRFVVQSGDSVLRGANASQWNVSFTPIVERLTRRAGIPYFFAAGNHDVSGMPLGDPGRAAGLRNTLAANSKLIPPDGSPRRLSGYPTYAIGYGNVFMITLDSNIARDPVQRAWVADQLEHIDHERYRHIVVVFHHPVYSSARHGGGEFEPSTATIRDLYMPLFRRHHVRLLIVGHDHVFEHWIERYADTKNDRQRLDEIVTGGGGAPVYEYVREPDLSAYVTSYASERVTVEHVAKPGPTTAENPHHFVVMQVDGDRLSLEVVSSGAALAPYNGRSRIDLSDRER